MDIDAINNDFYQTYGNEFDKIPFDQILPELILNYLPRRHCKILDIGSGAGALAQWLSYLGCEVACLEPSEKPAKAAADKGLKVYPVTFQKFDCNQLFDCIIAISSLIHIAKRELPDQILRIASFLEPGGVFIASFMLGRGEGLEDPTQKGKPRFFSKLTEEELRDMLKNSFSLLERHIIEVKKMNGSFLLLALRSLRTQSS